MNRLCEPLDAVFERVPASWQRWVQPWHASVEGRELVKFVESRRAAGAVIYPGAVFRALELTAFDAVRVVILGQDPYHAEGQAEGMAFSVPVGQRIPPSLRNIHAEMQRDLLIGPPSHGHLGGWARQGVLLLNTTLTVEAANPGSHAGRGWEALTRSLIYALAEDLRPKVFLLWGSHAQRCQPSSDRAAHAVFTSNHPSPLAARRGPRPFIGNGHFGAANRHLLAHGLSAIDWGALSP